MDIPEEYFNWPETKWDSYLSYLAEMLVDAYNSFADTVVELADPMLTMHLALQKQDALHAKIAAIHKSTFIIVFSVTSLHLRLPNSEEQRELDRQNDS